MVESFSKDITPYYLKPYYVLLKMIQLVHPNPSNTLYRQWQCYIDKGYCKSQFSKLYFCQNQAYVHHTYEQATGHMYQEYILVHS